MSDKIDELEKKFHQLFDHLKSIVDSVNTFSVPDLLVNFLFENEQEKVILIVSGGFGESTMPIVHDAPQLDSVFVFCFNKTRHEQWAKQWKKVKGVFDKIELLCQAVEQGIQQHKSTEPKPAAGLPKPSSDVRRSLTPEPPHRSTRHDKTTPGDEHRQKSKDRRHHSHSTVPVPDEDDGTAGSQTPARPMTADQKTSVASSQKETDVKTKPSIQSTEKVREAFAPTVTVTDDQHNMDRSNGQQKHTSVRPFKEDTTTNSNDSELVNSTPLPVRKTTNSQHKLPPDFERLERDVRKSLINNNDIDQLQHTLQQTITKHITKKKDDSNVLNQQQLLADLKQELVGLFIQQQQSALSQDAIKKIVTDALIEQQKAAATPAITTVQTNRRKPVALATSREVKITANPKLTRTDAAFRQQRDAVVANKRLRDAVQQWSSIKSMAELATTIKTQGQNNLEYAWLLFCWIGQNIQYREHCNNNSADTVFRTKQGVCRGFVSLYHECCSLLGIECSEISGYAKQAFLKKREDLQQSPHAWNSIVLDKHTYLIDPTWGAGGRDRDRKLEDFYFLTSPEELIYTHYCNGYQLLEPEISKADFLGLPVMKSFYYRLGLTLLSPKQGLNETSQNLFKIAIRAPAHVDLFVQLKVGDIEYPRNLHTLCQRDETQPDVYNCYITPPVDGLYDIGIYAKTNAETVYYNAIDMRLRVSDIVDAFTFPLLYTIFTEHKCILIEPLQRLVHENEQVLIHMIIPNANVLKILNGDDYMVPCTTEYKKGVLKKTVRVQGDLHICARWDDKADLISTICVFNMA